MFSSRLKQYVVALGPVTLVIVCGLYIGYHYIDPAPPGKIVLSTGSDEGDYQGYGQNYKDIIAADGVKLDLRSSTGAVENLARLNDPDSDVEAGFVQDGIGTETDSPGVVSLGSLYYEPLWIFYRASGPVLSRLIELKGKRVAVGESGGGTAILSRRLLTATGVNEKNTTFINKGWKGAATALKNGELDAFFAIATAEDPFIEELMQDKAYRLMSLDQAEAITRQLPYLHHLVLPHGTINLEHGVPAQDVDLVSATATLLVRDSLHPALVYLLMKAINEVHSQPGIFERKREFPIDKDYSFELSAEAQRFYKSGGRFWQRYLPFWLATLFDRFVFVILPLMVVIVPLIRLIPQVLDWRVRSRIYKRYGELKFLETQIRTAPKGAPSFDFLERLDAIEDNVNHMKVPLNFAEHIYGLREHIHFVRQRLVSPRPLNDGPTAAP